MSAKSSIAAAAAVRLTVRYSFWTEIFYSMTVVEATEGDGIETAATDGRMLWINPTWWKPKTLDEQVGVVAHELGHKIFLHPSRCGNRDPKIWNYACDFAINALLKQNGFTLPVPHLYDKKYEGMLAEAIYADLIKQQKAQPQQSGAGLAKDGQGNPIPGVGEACEALIDLRQQPGATPEQIEKHETEVKALVERAVANAKAMGSLPAGIEAGVVEVYKASKEPWYNRLHRYMQSLSSSTYNWARLNRRTLRSHGVFTPLHLSEALGDIALFIDASGSVYNAADQANFCGHLNAILAEARPHRVHLYYFDAEVYPGETIEAGELDINTRPRGGGGTCFIPIFQQLEDDGIEPEVCIILTDLEGSFPATAPNYPVVWATIIDHVAPFGETILVE
jgi:predicted metal-dependent peptidase